MNKTALWGLVCGISLFSGCFVDVAYATTVTANCVSSHSSDTLTNISCNESISDVFGSNTSTSDRIASADLATGQLKVDVTGERNAVSGSQTSIGGNGLALFRDGITINESRTEEIPVIINLRFDGFFSGNGAGSITAIVSAGCVGGCTGGNASNVEVTYIQGAVTADTSNSHGNHSESIVSLVASDIDILLSATVLLPASLDTISLRASLNAHVNPDASGGGGGIIRAGFGNTANLSIDLPSGYTFTSESGVLLSQAPEGTIPEPTTLALMGLGLAGIGYQRRRSKKAA